MESSREQQGGPGTASPPGAATMVEPADPMHEIVGRVRDITRANERLFARLLDGERRFRGLAKAVWRVQEEEQRRVARELHDGLGQTLTALTHQLERLRDRSEGGAPADLRARLADSIEMARLALNESRELSRLLRPPVLDDLGLPAALTWLARTLEKRTGLVVEADSSGLDGRLDQDVETLVFRLVQEGLNNVLKHAGILRAEVVVRRMGDLLVLRVADAGRGFDAAAALAPGAATAGVGLHGLRDRVELFGGRLELVSRPGEGTSLTAHVPLGGGDAP